MKKVVARIFLLCVLMMVFAGPAVAQPTTIPIKLENPVINILDTCTYLTPPDLGFETSVVFNETNTITNPSGEVIGSTVGCQFLKESWDEGGMHHDLLVSFFTFSLPDGDLVLHFTNHLKSTAGGTTLEVSGSIVDGTGSYEDAMGHVWGGGAWPKDMPTPIVVHLVLQLS
jgi:hypothetical protein